MKFYVAGKWQDRKNIRKLMDRIQDLGHALSYLLVIIVMAGIVGAMK